MENKKTYRMKHFTKGKEVGYNGYTYKVDYVVLNGPDLYVRLENHSQNVLADKLDCEPTEFLLERK